MIKRAYICDKCRWIEAVHEVIPPNGKIIYSDTAVSHKKIRAGDSDCYDYVPLLQICVCYDKLGDRKKAKEYRKILTYDTEKFNSIFNVSSDKIKKMCHGKTNLFVLS